MILPKGMTVEQVCADYLAYLKRCVKHSIKQRNAEGSKLWAALEGNIRYIMASVQLPLFATVAPELTHFRHPNGWKGSQRDSMRRAGRSDFSGVAEHPRRARDTRLTRRDLTSMTSTRSAPCGRSRSRDIQLCAVAASPSLNPIALDYEPLLSFEV